jgi:hypothetical protein
LPNALGAAIPPSDETLPVAAGSDVEASPGLEATSDAAPADPGMINVTGSIAAATTASSARILNANNSLGAR